MADVAGTVFRHPRGVKGMGGKHPRGGESVALQMDIDIERAVCVKLDYNETRPYLHGGKKA